jgi:hypothetical protein
MADFVAKKGGGLQVNVAAWLISGNGGLKDRRKECVCSERMRILDNLFCLSCSPV